MEKSQKKNTSSPFKEVELLEKEIKVFANKYKTIVHNQASRISDYFEMCCFNYIIKFYELNGYEIKIKNLQNGKYRYKCSTSGIQENFSFFQIKSKIENKTYTYDIHHNIAVQSSHDINLFTTPDIAVIVKNKAKVSDTYYDTKRKFSYVENSNLITFCEVKQFNPYPELLFNFIGVLNELKKDYMNKEYLENKGKILNPAHIAPSLMISGKPNKQTKTIKTSLENRYCINVVYDLFYSADITFSKNKVNQLQKARKINLPKNEIITINS